MRATRVAIEPNGGMMKNSTQRANGDPKRQTGRSAPAHPPSEPSRSWQEAAAPAPHGSERADESQSESRSLQNDAAPLPHESDQSAESQHEHAPRGIGKQAHRDVERGLEDTDRRGGDDYQQRTQNDAHTNRNSTHKPRRG
jgi:hypothetical protein